MIRDCVRYTAAALAGLILITLIAYCLWLYTRPGDLASACALGALLAAIVFGAFISLVGGR